MAVQRIGALALGLGGWGKAWPGGAARRCALRPSWLARWLVTGGLALAGALCSAAPAATPAAEPPDTDQGVLRCGWFEHPSAGKAWLTDRDGRWLVATPGGHRAPGRWPQFSDDRWISTHGAYGYGCACLRMEARLADKTVTRILRAGSRSLETCERAKSIRHPQPG